jgi:hypothetical protein
MEDVMSETPILNWKPTFDERSKDFPLRAAIKERPTRRTKKWRNGVILNQGREGACVGFGWTAEALSTPIAVDLSRLKADAPDDPTAFAHHIYQRAKVLDMWEGEDYDGTSVLAGAKAMREAGLVKEFRWCFNIEDVIDAVLTKGPVVLGIYWYDSMYDAPEGIVSVSGKIVGGHCITAVGFKLAKDSPTGEDTIILQNSWGYNWGTFGLAEIRVSELASLLDNAGEACVVTKRSYGR